MMETVSGFYGDGGRAMPPPLPESILGGGVALDGGGAALDGGAEDAPGEEEPEPEDIAASKAAYSSLLSLPSVLRSSCEKVCNTIGAALDSSLDTNPSRSLSSFLKLGASLAAWLSGARAKQAMIKAKQVLVLISSSSSSFFKECEACLLGIVEISVLDSEQALQSQVSCQAPIEYKYFNKIK
jgi:hypothetical protein